MWRSSKRALEGTPEPLTVAVMCTFPPLFARAVQATPALLLYRILRESIDPWEGQMAHKVLVTYGTWCGATQEIAETIVQSLRGYDLVFHALDHQSDEKEDG